MHGRVRSQILRYGLAVAGTLVATWLRLLVDPYLGERVPFVTFFLAVVVTAWFGGLGPTLLAVVLSSLAAALYFIPPADSLWPENTAGWIGLTLFVGFGAFTALLGEWMRRKDAQVREEWERFSVTLSSIGDGVIVTDQKAQVTFMNSVAERLTGWSLAEAQGKPLETVFHIVNERTRQAAENPVARALREGRVVGLANHTTLIAKDGSERAIDDSAAPIREGDGRIVGVVLVFRDVSQQRASQIASGRLAALVDSSEDAIIGQTFEAVVTDWNAGAHRLFGFTAEETVGRSMFSTIVLPDRQEELLQILRRVQRGEQVDPFETVRRCKDGRPIPVAIRISPIRDAEGAVVGASAIDRDISRQRAAARRRDARLAVTQILAHERSLEKAIADILAATCSALEWDVGCFWQLRPGKGALRCQEFWQTPSLRLSQFQTARAMRVFNWSRIF